MEYIANHRLGAPGTMVTAYQPGDPIAEQVVRDWGLTVGPDGDVSQADGFLPSRPADDSSDRFAWEAYVVGQGTSLDDARAASLDELRGMYEPPAPETPGHDLPASVSPEGVDGARVGQEQPIPPAVADSSAPTPDRAPEPADGTAEVERPAQSARKSEWVEYAVAAGADPGWARADDTTKDDLIAWEPGPGA